jgi:hypothetical protein
MAGSWGPVRARGRHRRGARRVARGAGMGPPAASVVAAMRPMWRQDRIAAGLTFHAGPSGGVGGDTSRTGDRRWPRMSVPDRHAQIVPVHRVEAGHRAGRSRRLCPVEELQQVAVARAGRETSCEEPGRRAVGAAHRLEAGDADGGNAERQRQAARGGDADADAGEVAGTHADGDGVERGQGQPASASTSSISGMRRSACPFAIAS